MKSILLCIILVLAFATGCNGGNAGEPASIRLSGESLKSDLTGTEYTVNGNTEIVMNDIEPYSLYGFFKTGSGRSAEADTGLSRGNAGLISTTGGTVLYYNEADAKDEIRISPRDMGITDSSRIKVVRFEPAEDVFSTDTNTEIPIGIIGGYEVFEKFFLADANIVADKSRVTLLRMSSGSVSGRSSMHSILSEGRIIYNMGLVDLSGFEKIGIFQQNRIQINDDNTKRRENNNLLYEEVKLITPVKIEKDVTMDAKTSSCYMIEASNEELVLEIDLKDTSFKDLSLKGYTMNARDTDGNHYPAVFPASLIGGKPIIYIGKPSNDIIFDYCTKKRDKSGLFAELETGFTLRSISEKEKAFITQFEWDIKDEKKQIALDESYYSADLGYGIIPIIFHDETGIGLDRVESMYSEINSEKLNNTMIYLMEGSESGKGYYTKTIIINTKDKEIMENTPLKDNYKLEYAYILFREGDIGKTIEIARNLRK